MNIPELTNDKERWEWVLANKDTGISVVLDNDDTYVISPEDDDGDRVILFRFNNYIGNSSGVGVFLETLNIPCEPV